MAQQEKGVRIRFEIEGEQPSLRYATMSAVPRRGDYVNLGDGQKRHAAYVQWVPYWAEEQDPKAPDLHYEVTVRLRRGNPDAT